jgi:hypothetical protein
MKFIAVLSTIILALTKMANTLSVQELLERNKFVPLTVITKEINLLTEQQTVLSFGACAVPQFEGSRIKRKCPQYCHG